VATASSKGEHPIQLCTGSEQFAPECVLVFAGRNRGCRRTDKVPEYRPRYLQGVISYNSLRPPAAAGSFEMQWAQACMTADAMTMQDVTIKERRVDLQQRPTSSSPAEPT
jgi:hypothetical protein